MCNEGLVDSVEDQRNRHLNTPRSQYGPEKITYYEEANQKFDVPEVFGITTEIIPPLNNTDAPQPTVEQSSVPDGISWLHTESIGSLRSSHDYSNENSTKAERDMDVSDYTVC